MPTEKNKQDTEDERLLELVQAVKAELPPSGRYEAARRNLLHKLAEKPKENPIMSTIQYFARPGLRRWATVSGLVLAVIAAALFLNPLGGNPSQAYAIAAAQLRQATTVSFSVAYALGENQAPTTLKIAFREPSLQRVEAAWEGQRIVSILDTASNKGLLLMPGEKVGNETEVSALPSAEHERLEMVKMLTQTVKNLPGEADAVLGEDTIDGRRVFGFRTHEDTFWIDAKMKTLVRVERLVGGRKMIVSDFRLDPPDLDASMFSLKLPAGYAAMTAQAIKIDAANPGEEDLIAYLRLLASAVVGRQFPPSINPMEMLTLQKDGKMSLDQADLTMEQKQRFPQDIAHYSQRQMLFTMGLKPENDFHYAGGGVKLGDAQTPIAWWKPNGLKNYRVIWGDLRVTEEPPEVIRVK